MSAGNKSQPLPPTNTFTSHLNAGASTLDNVSDTFAGRCQYFANLIKPTFGPLGLKIMTVNRFDRIKVTGDSKTILDQIITSGPDAKIIVDYVNMMHEECGDGCKLLIMLASELMIELNTLISRGLTRTEILGTFSKIEKEMPKLFRDITCETLPDLLDHTKMVQLIQKTVSSKVSNYSEKLSNLVYDSCLKILYPTDNKSKPVEFSPEFIRVCKIIGGSINDSYSMPGLYLDGKPSGSVQNRDSCKVAVFSCAFDYNRTEATAKVYFKSSAELKAFSSDEEEHIEKIVKGFSDLGIGLIISSGKSNDLMLHFANKYNIMVVNVSSKWMIRRLCVALDAQPLVSCHVPNPEALGFVDRAQYHEVNEEDYVEFYRKDSRVHTIVIHGTTEQLLDMAENGVSSGINLLRILARDQRLVAGGGAAEIQLGKKLRDIAQKEHNGEISSYVYDAMANVLERIAFTLIENSGITDPGLMIANLMSMHRSGNNNAGCAIDDDMTIRLVDNVAKHSILDALYTKEWALRYALNSIDQMGRVNIIIMAKSSDFNPKQKKDWDTLDTDI
ncbi:MAG: T-complex protein 1 subunit theta [Marteilia pararefringens]